MSDLAVMYSSETEEWATPPDLFARLDRRYRFTLDPCATAENATCSTFYTKAEDGLAQPWAPHRVFMNPPYGRAIGHWIRKAFEESRRGALVVCLVPARTDTRWWHTYASKGRILFLPDRIRFSNGDRAPFPSAIVIFDSSSVTAQSLTCNACEGCKAPVFAHRADARYCSGACRQKAYRQRKEAGHG